LFKIFLEKINIKLNRDEFNEIIILFIIFSFNFFSCLLRNNFKINLLNTTIININDSSLQISRSKLDKEVFASADDLEGINWFFVRKLKLKLK
jgi:hypothetical protein